MRSCTKAEEKEVGEGGVEAHEDGGFISRQRTEDDVFGMVQASPELSTMMGGLARQCDCRVESV